MTLKKIWMKVNNISNKGYELQLDKPHNQFCERGAPAYTITQNYAFFFPFFFVVPLETKLVTQLNPNPNLPRQLNKTDVKWKRIAITFKLKGEEIGF